MPQNEDDRPDSLEPAWEIRAPDIRDTQQDWLHEMSEAQQEPGEFSLLRKTPNISIFYKWAAKQLGVHKITQEILEGPTFNILKAWYRNNIEMEYQMEQVHLALTNQIDKTFPEGDKSKPDATKCLPVQEVDGQKLIPVEHQFNNDL
ncbi:hypothetical protein Tco_0348489 [Tanacetum coccineum]